MSMWEFTPSRLAGAWVIDCFYAGDQRGGFVKCFEQDLFEQAGIPFSLSETFASTSGASVIRGLHFQNHRPQAKLVSVLCGAVWDVMVDLRIGSPTFGQWEGFELSGANHRALYVPRGFAHGFYSREEGTVMLYQCDGRYDKATDGGIRFDDPDIGIIWPEGSERAIHSDRDLSLGSLREYLAFPMQTGSE